MTKRKGGTFFGEPTARQAIRVEKRPEEPAPAPPPPPEPGAKRVLGYEDLDYVGSFRVPGRVGGARAGYSASGLALSWNVRRRAACTNACTKSGASGHIAVNR